MGPHRTRNIEVSRHPDITQLAGDRHAAEGAGYRGVEADARGDSDIAGRVGSDKGRCERPDHVVCGLAADVGDADKATDRRAAPRRWRILSNKVAGQNALCRYIICAAAKWIERTSAHIAAEILDPWPYRKARLGDAEQCHAVEAIYDARTGNIEAGIDAEIRGGAAIADLGSGADPRAGIGPRNIEETLAVGVADPDVFDRRGDAASLEANGCDGDQQGGFETGFPNFGQ